MPCLMNAVLATCRGGRNARFLRQSASSKTSTEPQIKGMAARPGCRLEWIGDQVTWVGRVPGVAWLGSGQWHIGWGWLPTARTGRENVHDKIGTIPVYWDYYIDSFASYWTQHIHDFARYIGLNSLIRLTIVCETTVKHEDQVNFTLQPSVAIQCRHVIFMRKFCGVQFTWL